jgi:hypothetical protein
MKVPGFAASLAGLIALAACASRSVTHQEILAADARTRLFIVADDSMAGRSAGSPGALSAQRYVVSELRRLGLEPSGDSGTYEQSLKSVVRRVGESTLNVDEKSLTLWQDFLPIPWAWNTSGFDGATAVFGGELGKADLDSQVIAGAFVIFTSPSGRSVIPRVSANDPLHRAAAIAVVGLENFSESRLAPIRRGLDAGLVGSPLQRGVAPPSLLISTATAELLLGRSLDRATIGDRGKVVRGSAAFTDSIATVCCNIIGVVRGSDARLRDEFVALGAHLDHIGVTPLAVDHDSLRAANIRVWALKGMVSGGARTSSDQSRDVSNSPPAGVRPRRDSIFNGADDDGSGSVALLEIAERLSGNATRPARSVLFVWHTGEELGNQGSTWLTEHPPIPLASIIAQLNLDMIGRGGASDHAGGGPDYLQVIGSRRLSRDLGDLIEETNKTSRKPFRIDYRYDAPGDPNQFYCRSDHYEYARFGIPIAFFTTGEHADYHQVTDEAQYIDFAHLELITRFVYDVTMKLGSVSARPKLDGPKPDPKQGCRG